MNSKVNSFFLTLKKWATELEVLRSIILDFPLEEEIKWNTPCYMLEGKNVVIIYGFKEYFNVIDEYPSFLNFLAIFLVGVKIICL